jgi:hypothetical protein
MGNKEDRMVRKRSSKDGGGRVWCSLELIVEFHRYGSLR